MALFQGPGPLQGFRQSHSFAKVYRLDETEMHFGMLETHFGEMQMHFSAMSMHFAEHII